MANIKSAEKKNRQRIKREARNTAAKSEMRTAIKKLRAAIVAKKAAEARAALQPAVRLLARVGRRGAVKPGAASRTVGRLTRAVNALK